MSPGVHHQTVTQNFIFERWYLGKVFDASSYTTASMDVFFSYYCREYTFHRKIQWIGLVMKEKRRADLKPAHRLDFFKIPWHKFVELSWFFDYMQIVAYGFLENVKFLNLISSAFWWIFHYDYLTVIDDRWAATVLTIFQVLVSTAKSFKPISSWPITCHFLNKFFLWHCKQFQMACIFFVF